MAPHHALEDWLARAGPQPGAPGLQALRVSAPDWRRLGEAVAAASGSLMALWASGTSEETPRVHAVYLGGRPGLVASLALDARETPYPGLEDLFPAAARLQRAIADLNGLPCTAADTRPWLRHGAWSNDRPLRDAGGAEETPQPQPDRYAFVRVEGEGVHEIPVGPVHAGIIEPGHFRFSVVGEKVLRLEERLGYVHKGIERRFTELPPLEGHRLAARVSGDSAVAFGWAYCQALESLSEAVIPARAALLRALCLEIERIQNHLGDLGALGNDAGFAFGLTQFSLLKERVLRATEAALGQRYLLDAIVPGGVRADLTAGGARLLADCIAAVSLEVQVLRDIYDEHAGVRDRFVGAGQVSPELARRLGLCGLAGRASGQAFDLRADLPAPPYDMLGATTISRGEGDVAARVAVRFDELRESSALVQRIVELLPREAHRIDIAPPRPGLLAVGLIEGWRGPVLVALEIGPDGAIRRCHPHDPSWQNWPVLEYAILGNIVPDFPLINKSFNLSYSGHDL